MTALPISDDPLAAFVARLRPIRVSPQFNWRAISWGVGASVLVCLVGQISHFLARDNFHLVWRGQVYRSSQLSPSRLQKVIDTYRIRTIINLRGPCPEFTWYEDECRTSHEQNVSQEDIVLSAIRLPPPAEIRRLVDVLRHAQYPILLHCRQGVDRTGLAAVIVRLMEPGVSLPEARAQLGIRFGYIPYNGTENILKFIELYEEWLQAQHLPHSPALFVYWVKQQYCPGSCRAKLELSPDRPLLTSFAANKAASLILRAHNESIRTWKLRPGTWQGVHARYQITAADGQIVFHERAGLFDATILPGESIDLSIGIPALSPGRFTLFIDMVDADQNSFSQFGMEPIFRELQVTGP